MIAVLVGLLALVIVAVVVVRSVVVANRRGGAALEHNGDPADAWLQNASETARQGRRLARDVEPVTQVAESAAVDSSDVRRRLEGFTRVLAELATTAPTSMDARVCRSLAVSSQSLGDALGGAGRDPDPVVPAREARAQLVDRYTEFVTALGDLERHVDLL